MSEATGSLDIDRDESQEGVAVNRDRVPQPTRLDERQAYLEKFIDADPTVLGLGGCFCGRAPASLFSVGRFLSSLFR
jgi:hypothetical protein